MILQLDPEIPVRVLAHGECPGGKGYAKLIIDYSQEHHLVWLVSIDGDDGEGQPWCVENKNIRFPSNTTMGRYVRASLPRREGGE